MSPLILMLASILVWLIWSTGLACTVTVAISSCVQWHCYTLKMLFRFRCPLPLTFTASAYSLPHNTSWVFSYCLELSTPQCYSLMWISVLTAIYWRKEVPPMRVERSTNLWVKYKNMGNLILCPFSRTIALGFPLGLMANVFGHTNSARYMFYFVEWVSI